MSCPHCGVELVSDARFCPACGKATGEPDLVGREIGGRFRIVAKLGEGGMGSVYRAEQTSLRRPCAIKLLRAELSADPMLLRRFNAEAAAVAKLSHPNTVNIYDFGQDKDGSLFIAMELIEGRSLRKIVGAEAPLPPRRALAIAGQIAASLADAHAHDIVHRDLKPDNVMVQDRGRQRDVVRVLDFGIAKLRDDSRATQQAMTQAGDMLGTPQYMAPEQIRGEPVDGRTDIYALGCILYELLTGRQPFEAPSVMAMLSKHLMEAPIAPSARRPDLAIAPELDRLVLAAMMKDPRARPATMEQYGEHIAAVAAGLPADTARTGGGASGGLPVPSPPPAGTYETPVAPSFAPQAAAGTPRGPSFTPQQPQPAGYTPPQPAGYTPPQPFAPQPAGYTPPQPFAPQPAAYTAPPAARSGNGTLWIVLACVGVLVLAGGAWGIGLAMRSSTPARSPGSSPSAPQPVPTADPQPAPDHDQPAPVPAPSGSGSGSDPWAPGAAEMPPSEPAPSEPTPSEPAPSEPAATGGAGCDRVAAHLQQLMVAKIRSQAALLTPAQMAQVQQAMSQSMSALLTACSMQHWPARLRTCVVQATSYEQAARCK